MVKWCGGSVLSGLLLLLLVSSTANGDGSRDPQFRKRIKCDILEDGNYVFGCSRFYSICTNGNEHPMNCFDGLVLNPVNNQCDKPKDVSICHHQGDTNLYRSREPFTCAGKEDGNYEARICSAFYFQCRRGRQFDQPCPPGLAYSPKDNTCDFIDNCKKEAAGRPPISDSLIVADPNIGNINTDNADANLSRQSREGRDGNRLAGGQIGRRSSNYRQQQQHLADIASQLSEEVTSTVTNTLVESEVEVEDGSGEEDLEFDCSGKEDGVYPKGSIACTATFFDCMSGHSFEYFCPNGLMYNVDNQQCDNPQKIVACQEDDLVVPNAQQIPKKPEFDCAGKADGYYETSPCSTSLFHCNGGLDSQIMCPVGTLFDIASMLCVFPDECGKPKTTPPPEPLVSHGNAEYYFGQQRYQRQNIYNAQAPAPPPQQYQPPQEAPAPPPQQYQPPQATPTPYQAPTLPPAGFNCAGKQDGYYFRKPCIAAVIRCVGGHAHEQACLEGLVFDPSTSQCNYPSECGRPITTTTAAPYRPSVAPVAPAPRADFHCNGKPDGYAVKSQCSSTYYACSFGHTVQLSCPHGLVFDASANICEYPEQCGKPPTTTTTTVEPSPKIAFPAAKFDCMRRPDGYEVVSDCSNTYYACASGHTITMNCPSGMIFDGNTATCGYDEKCERPSTTAQPMIQPSKFAPSNRDCGNMTTGAHESAPCSPKYITCWNGEVGQGECFSGYVFNPANGQCDYHANVRGCHEVNSNTQQQQSQGPSTTTPHPPSHSNEFDCSRSQDGYFSKGCSSRYFACQQGITQAIECPGKLKFSQSDSACKYESHVIECGGGANNWDNRQQRQQSQSGYGFQGGNPCQSLVNGIYGRHCNRFYFYCIGHVIYDFACSMGEAFDTQTGRCAPHFNVPSCYSSRRYSN